MHRSQGQSERKGVIFWIKTEDDNYNLTKVYPHALRLMIKNHNHIPAAKTVQVLLIQ